MLLKGSVYDLYAFIQDGLRYLIAIFISYTILPTRFPFLALPVSFIIIITIPVSKPIFVLRGDFTFTLGRCIYEIRLNGDLLDHILVLTTIFTLLHWRVVNFVKGRVLHQLKFRDANLLLNSFVLS